MDDADVLVEEIRNLADEIDRVPRQKDVRNHLDTPLSRFRREFGSWNGAVEAAGFQPYPQRRRIPEEKLLNQLQSLAEELGHTPSAEEMTAYGDYSHAVYIDRFGSWKTAVDRADLAPVERRTAPTRQELVNELKRLADDLDRVPSSKDVEEESNYSYSAYYREFDGFTDALKAADLL